MMTQVIILAAGKGTRMNSDLPKALVPLGGKPMITYLLDSVFVSGIDDQPIVVVSPDNKEIISEALKGYRVKYAIQDQQLGTGHAVAVTEKIINPEVEQIIVLYCDHPFITAGSLKKFVAIKTKSVMIMPTFLKDYEDWRHNFYHWGRIVRNEFGRVEKIVEFKDATTSEQALTEVNPGFMSFNKSWLFDNVKLLNNDNKQHEYYLTSLPELAFKQGFEVDTLNVDPTEAIGINSQEELTIAEKLL